MNSFSSLRILTILIALLFQIKVHCQLPSIIPPSPEASQIGKYLDTPVNYFNGLPQIDIPLFEAKSGDIIVPISLSYHLGGIRVGEVASRVGLGWSLNAGGMVTRSVKGLPDDLLNGFYKTDETVEEWLAEDPSDRSILVSRALNQEIDYEPDVFMFNAPGISGKFIFNQDGEVLPIENTDYKIEYFDSGFRGITQFTITDNMGTKYFFGSYNGTHARDSTSFTQSFVESSSPSGITNSINYPLYYNAWHLLAIESQKDNSKVLFDYNFILTQGMDFNDQYKVNSTDASACEITEGVFASYNISETYEAIIARITFEKDTIEFNYSSTSRLDKSGDYLLQEIRHSNGFRYSLDQDYHKSFDESTMSVPGNLMNKSFFTHRLMLRGIKKWNETNTDYLEHAFEYHESNGMPNRLSYAQDMWGFYNGANSNATAIPHYFQPNYDVTPPGEFIYHVPGAERRTNSNYSKTLSLSSIIYPTGGKKEFNMESNGALRTGLDTQLHNSFFGLESDKLIDYSYTNGQSQTFQQNFTVTSDHIDQVLHFTYNVTGCENPDPEDPEDSGGIYYCGVEVMITGVNHSYSRSLSLANDGYFKVPPGTYSMDVLVVDNIPEGQIVSEASVTLEAFLNSSPYADYGEYEVGGLRLKSISLFGDKDNSFPALTKEFSYLRSDSTTSGILSAQKWSFYESQTSCELLPHSARVITSQSILPFLGTGTSHISYTSVGEYVTEFSGSQSFSNGMNVYNYEYAYDAPNIYSDTYPLFTPFKATPWRRGKLKETDVLEKDSQNSGFIIKEETENQYFHTSIIDSLNPPYTYPTYREIDAVLVTRSATNVSWGGEYKILTGGSQLLKTTKTVYEDGEKLLSSTNYEYDKSFYRADKITEINSRGDSVTTEVFYPEDYNEIENLSMQDKYVLMDMVDANMVNIPILTKKRIDGVTVNKDLTKFKSFSGSKYAPGFFEKWDIELNTFYETGEIIYDAELRPVEVHRPDGSVVSYLWGYGGVPVVKAINASYQDLTSFVSISSVELQQSDQDLRSLLIPLQSALPNAQISIYTYKRGIGVSSVTDPNGRTSKYKYDSFGRLNKVLDPDGNVLKKIDYTYKNN